MQIEGERYDMGELLSGWGINHICDGDVADRRGSQPPLSEANDVIPEFESRAAMRVRRALQATQSQTLNIMS
jgi:hypothetical protein